MLSGRATARPGDPRRYVGALTADIKKTYPQLDDVTADYAWSGTLGITMHRMPQIGELGPGVWLASGFGGHGLNTTAMAGNIVARAIVDGNSTWRQFTPFELVWAGGAFGRAAAQARIWMKRLSDRIEERRAKARELVHRHARDAELAREARQIAEAQPGALEMDGSGIAAAPTAEVVPLEEPATSAESIVPSLGGADGDPSLPCRQCNSLPRVREGEKSGAVRRTEPGAKPARGANEGAKP